MENKEILRIFETTGALQNGHFLLTSGLHSPSYFQCALVLQYPEYREQLCREIVDFYQTEGESIDVVIAPAVGGIMVALEVGRQLGVRSIFAERENGKMCLRRGFSLDPGESVLIVEDVITTGGSVREVVELVEAVGSYIVGVGCIVNRSRGKLDLDVPVFAVYESRLLTYQPEKCPLCKQRIPLVKPGSRGLQ
ncbi:MAG: orotate phosphoribosyltransferase [Calditrichaeota bacterium]|nr:MAG: orotate phosphoribosyltransferase [Calditrichota bacterium]